MQKSKLHVVYVGESFFADDLPFLKGDVEVSIQSAASLGKLEDPRELVKKLKACDLAIFKVNGGFEFVRYLQTFGEVPFIRAFFNSSKTKKALWTVDTHVMQGLEAQLSHQDYFDRIFSAHSPYMNGFNAEKSAWLPCFYRLSSINDLKTFNALEYPIERDVLFYYNPTPTGDRNEIALQAKAVCDKLGLRSLFGYVGNWGLFSRFSKTSLVNLNFSMQNDLNYRFFELQAFNTVQIANRVADHSKISPEWSGVHFAKRDLSDFEEVLQKALAHTEKVDGQKYVLSGHTLIHRLATIINKTMGTSLEVEIP